MFAGAEGPAPIMPWVVKASLGGMIPATRVLLLSAVGELRVDRAGAPLGSVLATARRPGYAVHMTSAAAKRRVEDPTFYPVEEKVGEDSLQTFVAELFRGLVERHLAVQGKPTFVGADQFIYWVQHHPEKVRWRPTCTSSPASPATGGSPA